MADEMDDRKNRYDERELGREFADPEYAERQQLARSFEDPNALDDARLGKSFEETNPFRLVGFVDQDINVLKILLEPGEQ